MYAVSREALTAMRQTVRSCHLQLKCDVELSDLVNMFGPVLRGSANYYARFYAKGNEPITATSERLSGALDATEI